MNRSSSIQLKAAFLLIVFSLNTVVVFACSVGLGMGFNGSHHHEEKAVLAHKKDAHQHSKLHHEHKDLVDDHQSSKKTNDNCCKDEAAKFAKIDKLTPQSLNFSSHPESFIAFFFSFYHFDVFASNSHIPNNKFFVRIHHPPISDIRVAIQSFQI